MGNWDAFEAKELAILTGGALFAVLFIYILAIAMVDRDKNQVIYQGNISGSAVRSYCDYGNNNLLYIAPNGSIAVVPGGCNGK